MSFVPYIEHYSPVPAASMEAFAALPQAQPQQPQSHPQSPWQQTDQNDFSNAPSTYSGSPDDQQQQLQQLQEALQQAHENDLMQPQIATLSPIDIQASTQVPSPTYDAPQVIQLIERPLRRVRPQATRNFSEPQKQAKVYQEARSQSQSPTTHLNTPAHTPTEQYSRHTEACDRSPSNQRVELQDSKVAKIAKTQRRGASDGRAQARLSTHPYQRQTPKGDSKNVMAGGIRANSSPVDSMTMQPPPPPPPGKEVKRYLLRADVHYNSATNIITAMLELPGVKSADVRIGVNVCEQTKEKQIVVRGRSRPLLPVCKPTTNSKTIQCYFRQERKLGEFKRVLVVPSELKPEHVQASFEDGILFLKYPKDPKQSDESNGSPAN